MPSTGIANNASTIPAAPWRSGPGSMAISAWLFGSCNGPTLSRQLRSPPDPRPPRKRGPDQGPGEGWCHAQPPAQPSRSAWHNTTTRDHVRRSPNATANPTRAWARTPGTPTGDGRPPEDGDSLTRRHRPQRRGDAGRSLPGSGAAPEPRWPPAASGLAPAPSPRSTPALANDAGQPRTRGGRPTTAGWQRRDQRRDDAPKQQPCPDGAARAQAAPGPRRGRRGGSGPPTGRRTGMPSEQQPGEKTAATTKGPTGRRADLTQAGPKGQTGMPAGMQTRGRPER